MLKRTLKILMLLLAVGYSTVAQNKMLKTAKILSKTLITQTGYCSDGSDRAIDGVRRFHGPMEAKIISFKDYQYIAYYEGNGDVVIARKNLKTNSDWEKSILQGYQIKSEDRHNKIAISN